VRQCHSSNQGQAIRHASLSLQYDLFDHTLVEVLNNQTSSGTTSVDGASFRRRQLGELFGDDDLDPEIIAAEAAQASQEAAVGGGFVAEDFEEMFDESDPDSSDAVTAASEIFGSFSVGVEGLIELAQQEEAQDLLGEVVTLVGAHNGSAVIATTCKAVSFTVTAGKYNKTQGGQKTFHQTDQSKAYGFKEPSVFTNSTETCKALKMWVVISNPGGTALSPTVLTASGPTTVTFKAETFTVTGSAMQLIKASAVVVFAFLALFV